MPRGASPKREHEYEELKSRFKKEGRYKGRETEVAARIVNKQRAMYGETKEDKKQDREGTNPDRNLPVEHYRALTTPQVASKVKKLSKKQLDKVEHYEKEHKNRKSVVGVIEKAKHDSGQKRKKAA